jgi:predicted dehydrogenase
VTGFVDTVVFSYPVDDTTSFLLRFDDGAHGVVTTYWTTPDMEQTGLNIVEVYGTEGRIVAAPINAKKSEGFLRLTRADESVEFLGRQNTHVAMLQDFVRAVDEDRDPWVSGRDGLVNMRVLEGAVESSRTGHTVSVE